jgi:putative hemolysin
MAEGEEPPKIELIDPDEREMIAGIIEMGQRYASELMIPRPDVVALDVTTSIDDALDVAIKHGHSRLPVYKEDIDHIVGILHVKDLLQAMRHPHQEVALRDMLRPVHYVPDTARADDILRDMLRNRIHMAVVVDEYGGTSGVLTIEDVIEEIVGEIRDEYDAAEESPFTRISENESVFNGSVSVNEFNDVFGAELPTGESDTLGGLIYTQLGRLPRVGDRVRIGNVELTVSALNGRRIKQVRALKIPPEPQTAAKQNEENQSK